VHQRGAFDDMPLQQIVADFERLYPGLGTGAQGLRAHDFVADIDQTGTA
jgi:hypothetical protein